MVILWYFRAKGSGEWKKSIFYKGQYISQCFPLTHTGESTQCNRETISEGDTEEIIGQVASNGVKVPAWFANHTHVQTQ